MKMRLALHIALPAISPGAHRLPRSQRQAMESLPKPAPASSGSPSKYRLIAFVHYRQSAVYIKHILTDFATLIWPLSMA